MAYLIPAKTKTPNMAQFSVKSNNPKRPQICYFKIIKVLFNVFTVFRAILEHFEAIKMTKMKFENIYSAISGTIEFQKMAL